jgi:quercetin dioxygenase-like cupin family protein
VTVGIAASNSFVRQADAGEDLWILGGLFSFKATPSESGAYLACEVQAPDGYAIPIHFHDNDDEGFYVARGEVTFFVDDEERRVGTGGFALVARGLQHGFRFETPDTVLLVLASPGADHVGLFRGIGEPATEHVIPDSAGNLDPDALGPIAAGVGTHIVGPPRIRG